MVYEEYGDTAFMSGAPLRSDFVGCSISSGSISYFAAAGLVVWGIISDICHTRIFGADILFHADLHFGVLYDIPNGNTDSGNVGY